MKTPAEEKQRFANNEIHLAKLILANEPDNQSQKDRLAYWSLEIGDIKTAKEFGTSDKLLGLIQAYERRNSV